MDPLSLGVGIAIGLALLVVIVLVVWLEREPRLDDAQLDTLGAIWNMPRKRGETNRDYRKRLRRGLRRERV